MYDWAVIEASVVSLRVMKTNEVDTMMAAIARFQSTLGLAIVQDNGTSPWHDPI